MTQSFHDLLIDCTKQPPGGVTAGQVFLVSKPENFPKIENKVNVPVGKWKDGLFACFDIGPCHATNWIAVFCPEGK